MGAGILPQSNACHEARTIYWRLLLMNSVGLASVRSALFCRLARGRFVTGGGYASGGTLHIFR
jgi:hypothetical protein